MNNTSMGYHTFSFFQKTKDNEFYLLTQDFIEFANKNSDMKRFPLKNQKGWVYTYENDKGIRWILLSFKDKYGFATCGVMPVINPKALIEKNYIRAAQENDLELVEKIYNKEAERISPILLKFGLCPMNRADPCFNVDLKELGFPCTPEQMMTLIKQGNIPKHYKERKEEYDTKQHRKITDKNSFYLESKSAIINYYWKYPQQDETHPNFALREQSRNVIRFEVQCKYAKLYAISKNIKQISKFYISADDISFEELYERLADDLHNPSVPVDVVLSDKVSNDISQKHFYKILRKGDYFILDVARDIVKSYNFRRDKEERIIYTLKLINDCHGITKAKLKIYGPDLVDFNRSLKDLDDILVNPVTIPRRWHIKHIPNLLHAYYDAVYEEQLMPKQEYLARKRIDEILQNII